MSLHADEKSEFIERVAEDLGALADYGFKSLSVSERGRITTLSVSKGGIALEVELDWQECGAYLLVVCLEHGKSPSGYYVADGQPCRYHLLKVVEDQKFDVDPDLILRARQFACRPAETTKYAIERMQAQVTALMTVLEACMGQLLHAGQEIFKRET